MTAAAPPLLSIVSSPLSGASTSKPVDPAMPIFAVGQALCVFGLLGLFRSFVRFVASLEPDTLLCLLSLFAGAAFIFVISALELCKDGAWHERMQRFLWRQMQVGQRLCLLCNVPHLLRRAEVQVILDGISPTAARVVGTSISDIRDFLKPLAWPGRLLRGGAAGADRASGAASVAGSQLANAPSQSSQDLASALAWLRRPRLSLGYDEQLQLFGLARQAEHGDYPAAAEGQRSAASAAVPSGRWPVERAKRRSWEELRGLARDRASARLLKRLTELDPAFRSAHPELAARSAVRMPGTPPQTPAADLARLLLELLQLRLPADLDDRASRLKSRAALATAAFAALAFLWRSRRLRELRHRTQRLPWGGVASAAGCLYYTALYLGLPPAVHAQLPRSLRKLPATAERVSQVFVGGSAAQALCRWAAQQLVPPVRGSLLVG